MRGRDAIAVALRHPDGRIVCATERLDAGFHAKPLVEVAVRPRPRRPVRDAGRRHPLADPQREPAGERRGRRARQLVRRADARDHRSSSASASSSCCRCSSPASRPPSVDNGLVQHLVEGLIRVALFLGYLVLICRAPDIHRVFQYHGAEHMTIHALEAGDPLTVDEVRKYPTAHQRCGTEFLVIVILLSILAFSLVGRQSIPVMIAQPDPADPGDRRGRLRDPQVRGAPPQEPGREGPAVPGPAGPDDHDEAADRRHDRGRDRVDGAGARGRRRGRPGRLDRRSSASRCVSAQPAEPAGATPGDPPSGS